MKERARLQFRLVDREAQESAIRRLALRGLDENAIAQETGWATDDLRRLLAPEAVPGFIPWALGKFRRSRSPGGTLK
jgi:hypothetical protein